jgi:NAD(P)-dependent dehydrogenase (short-subunit alcohol dehydrogenase family)
VHEFAGKVAIVTGGASGIGLATTRLLAARGASVVVAGIDEAEIGGLGRLVPDGPGEVTGRVVDVTDEAAVRDLVEYAVTRHGGLDVVVTAAGIQRYGTAAETTSDEWDEVLTVNLKGCHLTVRNALPHLRRRGGGAVVLVSSVQAFVTQSAVAAYTASKAALNALARSIAVDEAPNGIRANAVCPGSVDTPMLRAAARRFSDGTDAGEQALVEKWGTMHPLGRVARSDEVAEAVAFLASDRAGFVTGVALPVDGGLLAVGPRGGARPPPPSCYGTAGPPRSPCRWRRRCGTRPARTGAGSSAPWSRSRPPTAGSASANSAAAVSRPRRPSAGCGTTWSGTTRSTWRRCGSRSATRRRRSTTTGCRCTPPSSSRAST